MKNEINEINWEEIMDKFSSYDGVITEFCRKNSISPHQLFYRRKKLRKESKSNFHPIILKKTENAKPSCDSDFQKSKEIRVEIGKATLFIPSNETAILSEIVKELVKTC